MSMKKSIVLVLIIIVTLLGVSYAWFNITKIGENQKIITGSLYLILEDKTDAFSLTNVYPLSTEEARLREDNVMTFSVTGKNTSSSDNIHYEIVLKNGDEENNMTRFNPEHLVFDLIEVGDNNEETYLLDAVSFPSIDERRIWIDTVLHDTDEEIERTYKLRMWLSDSVLISDSNPNADYTAHSGTSTDFKNYYASIKIAVNGDMQQKSLPSSVRTSDTFVENGRSYFRVNLSNDYLLEEEGELLDENDTVRIVITNPENKLYFTYRDSEGNTELTQSESLDVTYVYNRNKTNTIQVFTESKDDSNVNTDLHFSVYKNGNLVQEYNKKINVIGNNYCLNHGFTKLSDCILVTDNLSKNVSIAKEQIANKGEPNVNDTAPSYTYEYHMSDTLSTNISLGDNPYLAQSFVFDVASGKYTLYNARHDKIMREDFIGYYAAPQSGSCSYFASGIDTCGYLYKIVNIHTDTNTIDGYKIESFETSVLDSQIGLYQVPDYNNKYSYVFRGAVENNNVKFGDMYWKIIRINGDGGIRLIYNGTTLNADGNKTAGNSTGIGRYAFNVPFTGPTYSGYMYNESATPTESATVTHRGSRVNNTLKYYWGDDYVVETGSDGITRFRIKSTNYPLVQMTTTEMKTATGTNTSGIEVSQLSLTPYTCLVTTSNDTCLTLMNVSSIPNDIAIKTTYITMSPENKELAQTNNKDSNAKKKIDEWYVNVFSTKLNNGKNVTTYLTDSVFCNDRRTNDSGYLLNYATNFFAYYRLRIDEVKTATLTCDKNDSFTVTESNISNGNLAYPVGLITADEVALAGGRFNTKNDKYYLYTSANYLTMTSSSYGHDMAYALVYYVPTDGGIKTAIVYSTTSSLRPVINLNKDVTFMRGDGTASNPYVIE